MIKVSIVSTDALQLLSRTQRDRFQTGQRHPRKCADVMRGGERNGRKLWTINKPGAQMDSDIAKGPAETQ